MAKLKGGKMQTKIKNPLSFNLSQNARNKLECLETQLKIAKINIIEKAIALFYEQEKEQSPLKDFVGILKNDESFNLSYKNTKEHETL